MARKIMFFFHFCKQTRKCFRQLILIAMLSVLDGHPAPLWYKHSSSNLRDWSLASAPAAKELRALPSENEMRNFPSWILLGMHQKKSCREEGGRLPRWEAECCPSGLRAHQGRYRRGKCHRPMNASAPQTKNSFITFWIKWSQTHDDDHSRRCDWHRN